MADNNIILEESKSISNVSIRHTGDESMSRRGGFAHESCYVMTYEKNGESKVETEKSRCLYINRTWEVYRFQTSRGQCMYQIKERRRGLLKPLFLEAVGKSRMSPKLKEQFEEVLMADPIYKAAHDEYEKIYSWR